MRSININQLFYLISSFYIQTVRSWEITNRFASQRCHMSAVIDKTVTVR